METRRRLVALGLAAAVLFAVSFVLLPHSPRELERVVSAAGPLAAAAFIRLWLVATPSLASGTLLAAAGGMLLGPVLGSCVAVLGATAGGVVAFRIARFAGRDGRAAWGCARSA
jgi:uncharacterized membrane protein YdjX (TVP38/TMEM64 family)